MKGNMQKLNNTIGNKTNCKRKIRKEGESQSTRNQKGITLVALVITIIVIIILSTVAINFIFGDNGLIRQAEQARDYYANDTEYTDDSLTNVDSYIDEIVNGEKNTLVGHVKWVGYGNKENCYILDDRGNLYSTSEYTSETDYQKEKIEDLQIELTNISMTDSFNAVTNDNKIMFYDNDTREWKEASVDESFPGILALEGEIIDINGYYWNINSEGELIKDEYRTYSILPDEEISIKEIQSKSSNIAVIDENGKLWMQGENDRGQLGNGTTEYSDVLIPVSGINKKIVRIEMSYDGESIMALDEDGSVWIWGENHSTVPQKVNNVNKRIIDILIGGNDFSALDEEGNVWFLYDVDNPKKIECDVKIKKIVGKTNTNGIDENGEIWIISTEGKGNLSRIDETENPFYGQKIEEAYYSVKSWGNVDIYINNEYIIWEKSGW